ncbi:hypothetical protein B0J18DRAFT_71146 [Chaetomium sp. MPI-SDFR-AT-0129]|nr:hypothetical protein B0J18DRAFT_71146 [Chaetomium sp. MPI-SDFR-AT-0129]
MVRQRRRRDLWGKRSLVGGNEDNRIGRDVDYIIPPRRRMTETQRRRLGPLHPCSLRGLHVGLSGLSRSTPICDFISLEAGAHAGKGGDDGGAEANWRDWGPPRTFGWLALSHHASNRQTTDRRTVRPASQQRPPPSKILSNCACQLGSEGLLRDKRKRKGAQTGACRMVRPCGRGLSVPPSRRAGWPITACQMWQQRRSPTANHTGVERETVTQPRVKAPSGVQLFVLSFLPFMFTGFDRPLSSSSRRMRAQIQESRFTSRSQFASKKAQDAWTLLMGLHRGF